MAVSRHKIRPPYRIKSVAALQPARVDPRMSFSEAMARNDAQALRHRVALLKEELRRTAKSAYNKGHQDGMVAQEAAQGEKVNHELANLVSTAATLRQEFETALVDLDEPLRLLVLEMVHKLTGDILSDIGNIEKIVTSQVAALLKGVAADQEGVVTLPEDTYQYIINSDISLELPPGISLAADKLLQPGDCRLETAKTIVDGRLSSRLERLAGALT